MSSDAGYYGARRQSLLRNFDRVAKRIRRALVRSYGEPFADQVLEDARRRFDESIEEMPYIGGRRNIFTWVMIVNGGMVALFRAMQARGKTAQETVRICAEVSDEMFRLLPPWLLRLVGRLGFSAIARRTLRHQALQSQERQYPDDFVYTFHEGGGDDWEIRFTECAVNKFYDAQNVPELKPYCNFFDVTYSRLMGMGVDARETIGLGCENCRLRYKHGRATPIPQRLEGVLPRT
jgi:hypothetical protein